MSQLHRRISKSYRKVPNTMHEICDPCNLEDLVLDFYNKHKVGVLKILRDMTTLIIPCTGFSNEKSPHLPWIYKQKSP